MIYRPTQGHVHLSFDRLPVASMDDGTNLLHYDFGSSDATTSKHHQLHLANRNRQHCDVLKELVKELVQLVSLRT
jgi:hypothetical protein